GGERAPRHPQRQGGRVALPHDLQLHRGMPARHRGDEGDRRGQGGCAARQARHPEAVAPRPAGPTAPKSRRLCDWSRLLLPVWADSVTHSLTWAVYSLTWALRSVAWAPVFLDSGARKG